MKRVVRPGSKGFLQVAKGAMSYVDKAEWERILEGFPGEQRTARPAFAERWVLVPKVNR